MARTMVSVAEDGPAELQAIACYAMAETLRERGEIAGARRWIREAQRIHERQGDPELIACDWISLGELDEELGDYSAAVAAWSRAAVLLESSREPAAMHDLMLDLGRGYAQLGERVLSDLCCVRAERLAGQWAS